MPALASHDCGPRSVMAICRKWGIANDLQELIDWSDCGPQGCSFAGLRAALRRLGLDGVGLQLSPGRLAQRMSTALGAVVQLKPRHCVALLSCTDDAFEIHDPDRCRNDTDLRDEEWLMHHWTGHALLVYGQIDD